MKLTQKIPENVAALHAMTTKGFQVFNVAWFLVDVVILFNEENNINKDSDLLTNLKLLIYEYFHVF